MKHALPLIATLLLTPLTASPAAEDIEPTWKSMATNYQPPRWLQDGKVGVWMHWGISSAADDNRPHDGSHYGRRMYGNDGFISPGKKGASERDAAMNTALTEWHTQRYGHPSEFGYEDLIPLFKAEKWDPDGLVGFFKDCGAHFIMPVATHHDNFDMYDSSFPWNSVDMGPKRDTIQEWKDAAKKHGLKFGVSTRLYWSPRFFSAARKYQKPDTLESKLFNMDYKPVGFENHDSWNEHWYGRCWELIEKYDPDMFNNDSPYPKLGSGKGFGLKLFTDYLNRDPKENGGKQTSVLSFKDANRDKAAFAYNMERGSAGEIQAHPWMWATDLSGNWFYRKGAVNRMSIPVLIGNAVDAISKNGVVMLKLNNRCENNIVADIIAPPRGYYLALREGPMTDAAIVRNILYSSNEVTTFIDELPAGKGRTTEDRRGRGLARSKDADTDYNIYYCSADRELGKAMLEKQQSDGVDAHSLAVDPLFVDPEHGDFRLKPNSSALKLGFVSFDMSKVGLVEVQGGHRPPPRAARESPFLMGNKPPVTQKNGAYGTSR